MSKFCITVLLHLILFLNYSRAYLLYTLIFNGMYGGGRGGNDGNKPPAHFTKRKKRRRNYLIRIIFVTFSGACQMYATHHITVIMSNKSL